MCENTRVKQSPEVVLARIEHRYQTTPRPCENPLCHTLLSWQPGRGRPQRYCQRACRDAVRNRRQQLRTDLKYLHATLEKVRNDGHDPDTLEALDALLRWHHNLYPDTP